MTISLQHRKSIGAFDGDVLQWPNSVAVFDDGRIAVADAGNNRVCVFDPDGVLLWSHAPGIGFAPENLREPIYVAVSPDQFLFVSDWHNHRFLIFTPSLKFSHTLFHMGDVRNSGFFRRLSLFLKHLMTRGVGAPYYFTYDKMKDQKNKKASYSLLLFFNGLFYYIQNISQPMKLFKASDLGVRKANGIVFQDHGQIVITQKANCCVSVYQISEDYKDVQLVRHIHEAHGKPFDRLCNITQGPDGKIYACDQMNHRIVVFDADLNAVDEIAYAVSDDIPMAPFGCGVLGDRYLAAARSFGFEIRDIASGKTVYESNDMGETHGMAWDKTRSYLYYVDRSNSRIEQFHVSGLGD